MRDALALTLVVPLTEDEGRADEWPRLPGFERLFARGRCEPAIPDRSRLLFSLFGLSFQTEEEVPSAALCWLAESGEAGGDWWLRADPVYLVPERDHLCLAAFPVALSEEEALRLIHEVNGLLAEEGLRIEWRDPGHGYLRSSSPARIRTAPPYAALGRDIRPFLPRGPDALSWQSRLNALQMVLHESEVNRQREERGLPLANSLWFWGGGRLPQHVEAPWDEVWSNDCLAQGLAAAAGIPRQSLSVEAMLSGPVGTQRGARLVVLDPVAGQSQTLKELDRRWIKPLLEAVARGRLAQVSVIIGCAHWRIDRSGLRRWWRRPRRFSPAGFSCP